MGNIYVDFLLLQAGILTSMDGVFKNICKNGYPIHIPDVKPLPYLHVHFHLDPLVPCFSGIGGQDAVHGTVPADICNPLVFDILAILHQIRKQLVKFLFLGIFLHQQHMVSRIVVNPGGFFF